ncbi:ABC transporter permease [Staphylospora marina]|uniref:ABC transporter permease n=1 Tax=Staphylospora marina TaxID=2490858 RepID=UPI000F5BD0AF|nr:ABC transporter permease [Staphylospora marina]
MLRTVLNRLVQMGLTLWVIATVTFLMMQAVPGDPFTGERKLPDEVLRNLRAHYHLDEPVPVQYVMYMKNLLTLDLGVSIKYESRTVNDMVKEGFPVSARVGAQALLLSVLVGLFLGTVAALRHNRGLDHTATVLAVLGVSIPGFVLAPLLQRLFGVEWELLPIATYEGAASTILPTAALAAFPLATITRLMRSGMVEVLNQDYVRTARAKGLPPVWVVLRHTVRNAILPVVTVLGPLMVGIMTGSFVIESIFSLPGIGKYFVESVINRDYPLIMGVTMFYSFLLISANFLVDLLYEWIDPRIRLTKKEGM